MVFISVRLVLRTSVVIHVLATLVATITCQKKSGKKYWIFEMFFAGEKNSLNDGVQHSATQ